MLSVIILMQYILNVANREKEEIIEVYNKSRGIVIE